MPAPTASPTVTSIIGLKDVVIAPLTADTDSTLTYGTLQAFTVAIDAQIAPDNTAPRNQAHNGNGGRAVGHPRDGFG